MGFEGSDSAPEHLGMQVVTSRFWSFSGSDSVEALMGRWSSIHETQVIQRQVAVCHGRVIHPVGGTFEEFQILGNEAGMRNQAFSS